MKYTLLFIVFTVFSAGLSALENAAKIIRVEGTAEVLHHKHTSWEVCEKNGLIVEGERIRTAYRSNIDIELPDGSILKLGEATVVTLGMVQLGNKSRFNLFAGKIISRVKKLTAAESSFQITTPTAVAAVRGTEFGMSFDPSSRENKVAVFEGSVAVSVNTNEVTNAAPSAKPVIINRNETITFKNAEVPATASIYNPVKEGEQWNFRVYDKRKNDGINIDRNKKW
ncbi:MAG: FecR domain-containing protein [Spirochaetes bacterium]|nr:FecR domain-containing protein [Spirochaetota bacterium]